MWERHRFVWGLLGLLTAAPVQAASGEVEAEVVVLTGNVVCLGENAQPLPEGLRCEDQFPPRFAFQAEEGNFYLFKADDARTVMFTDPRVREKTLRVSAWRRHEELEITKIQAVHEGEVFDLFYYCELCHIVSYAPGPCWCCQEDFEFVVKPLDEQKQERTDP